VEVFDGLDLGWCHRVQFIVVFHIVSYAGDTCQLIQFS
jgi:hypothetical protein